MAWQYFKQEFAGYGLEAIGAMLADTENVGEAKKKKEPVFSDPMMQQQYEDLLKTKTPEEAEAMVRQAHKEYFGDSAKFYGKESVSEREYPKEYFVKPEVAEKAKETGLADVENDDLTPDGLIAKMKEWDEQDKGVPAYVYDSTAETLKKAGKAMPEGIRRLAEEA